MPRLRICTHWLATRTLQVAEITNHPKKHLCGKHWKPVIRQILKFICFQATRWISMRKTAPTTLSVTGTHMQLGPKIRSLLKIIPEVKIGNQLVSIYTNIYNSSFCWISLYQILSCSSDKCLSVIAALAFRSPSSLPCLSGYRPGW